ncbi:uncharacterized protein J4E78_009062 [Alternaria triticimaculans]|uniref:uncharacterized protein n=1 Tax=Alternaria triticimaculans TaxID=297637 RepID=UPI0020C42231|nr:uncharacterized protein J4E78_009062 [Alternaria triticimaculans]KAI4647087.1 hypothetical protein J4E78_009062 [Alternaria triticimaculans]
MALSVEQKQMRFLAVVLPSLTLCTHTLLALSFLLPGSDPNRAVFSITYNAIAGSASILGLVGAIRLLPRLVSAYTIVHAITLSFVTIALVNLILPFDFRLLNPVIPSYAVDGSLLCRDIDAGFGWDDEWLEKCSMTFIVVKFAIAGLGLSLMGAQWWALCSVRSWGQELGGQDRSGEDDVEKAGLGQRDYVRYDEKTEF